MWSNKQGNLPHRLENHQEHKKYVQPVPPGNPVKLRVLHAPQNQPLSLHQVWGKALETIACSEHHQQLLMIVGH